MSLTFTDWENCTDSVTGQAFVLNWTADTGMGLYTHLEGMRQAISDKYDMTGTTLTGILASEVPLGTCKLKDTCTAIDVAVTAMIPKFVNHTDNGGNWQGQATCAPVWTSATILTAIGAASRILSGDKKQITVEWMKQVQALLNMMRWTRGIPSLINVVRYEGTAFYKSSLVEAVDVAISTMYVGGSSTGGIRILSFAYDNNGGTPPPVYMGYAWRNIGQYRSTGIPFLIRDTHFYAFTAPADDGFIGETDHEFNDNGHGWYNTGYSLIETTTSDLAITHTTGYPIAAGEAIPKYPAEADRWGANIGVMLYSPVLVLKWDVPGGSKFQ